ncbi:geranylgeranyl reductase family protein [Candidatus Thorarchaeota archaeon]|nr:MAG: geranylgeranyl reductase family protein [Candidatus Thorarchaeota archaeon]
MPEYDVIVVGGGPAGATAARRAAQAGLGVVVLDMAKFPRYKSCAGAIPIEARELLDFDITDILHRNISGLALFAPQGFRVDCIPEDRSKPGHTVMRSEFDNLLLRKAVEAGAEVREETKVLNASQNRHAATIVTEGGEQISSRFLVGADGINGVVARKLGFYSGWPSSSAFVAIEIEAEIGESKVREICGEPSGYDADLFFLYFGHVPHGYIWCFPKHSILSLGACCRQDKVKGLRKTYDKWFSEFCENYKITPNILSESGARFPCAVRSPITKGRAILVGDAAGFVDAFTGEGIKYAIHSGILAAKTLKEALRADDPDLLQQYEKDCKKEIVSVLKVSEYMAGLFYKSQKNMQILMRFFKEDNYASYLIAAMIGGLLPAKAVRRKITMRMLRTRPRDAISLMI